MNQLVPLTNTPNQTLVTSLNIDGVVEDTTLVLRYNEIAGYWAMTVKDVNGNLVLDSIPLVTGNAPAGNVLGQFAYLGIGSAYVINAGGVPFPDYPNSLDLGSDFVLIWGDTPAPNGSLLTEVSEGFAIAMLYVKFLPHAPGLPNNMRMQVTLKGTSNIVNGDTVLFSGLTGATWANGLTMLVASSDGVTIIGTIITNAGSAYGPAAETGVLTRL